MHWGIETCRSFLSYNSVLSILCICWLYVVNILCICRLYLVNILWICWLYVLNTSILCVCWLYVINIFCICCLYVVNSSIMFSLIWTLTIIRGRAEIVKCLAEFYGHPVPSTLSVAHILISSFFFSQTQSMPSPHVSHRYKKCEALYFGRCYTFHFEFIDRTSKYFSDMWSLWQFEIYFVSWHMCCFCVWAVWMPTLFQFSSEYRIL